MGMSDHNCTATTLRRASRAKGTEGDEWGGELISDHAGSAPSLSRSWAGWRGPGGAARSRVIEFGSYQLGDEPTPVDVDRGAVWWVSTSWATGSRWLGTGKTSS